MIFARRALQSRLDELRNHLDASAVAKLVDRLNRPGKDRMAAMWEVVVLHSLSKIGELKNEVALESGRRPDVAFSNGYLSITADVTAVSDEGLDEQNPYQEFSDLINETASRLGMKRSGIDIRVG